MVPVALPGGRGRGPLTVSSADQGSALPGILQRQCRQPGAWRVVGGMSEGIGGPAMGCPRPGPQGGPTRAAVFCLGRAVLPGPNWHRTPEAGGWRAPFLYPTWTPCSSSQVPPEKRRCAVGSILSEGEESPCPELLQLYQKFGFKVFSFPAPSHVVTATFPYTTALSIWLATRRVHPALDAYIKVS